MAEPGQGEQGVDLTKKGRPPSSEEVEQFHTQADTDARKEAIHHTIGAGENQAASGAHNHRGGDSVQLLTGITLTESFAMLPTASVSGFYFAHPESSYFGVARIGRDQLADYAVRRGVSIEQAEIWCRPNLD